MFFLTDTLFALSQILNRLNLYMLLLLNITLFFLEGIIQRITLRSDRLTDLCDVYRDAPKSYIG